MFFLLSLYERGHVRPDQAITAIRAVTLSHDQALPAYDPTLSDGWTGSGPRNGDRG
jgi:hypothetical protein